MLQTRPGLAGHAGRLRLSPNARLKTGSWGSCKKKKKNRRKPKKKRKPKETFKGTSLVGNETTWQPGAWATRQGGLGRERPPSLQGTEGMALLERLHCRAPPADRTGHPALTSILFSDSQGTRRLRSEIADPWSRAPSGNACPGPSPPLCSPCDLGR